ncbi:2-oxoglutarate dehydrogenase complex dihydrolipoyllysine-residue succinyltransferase [Bdellovibrio bacteriovorus]|uniref:Dihydrolipoyllysine-residue succinyltransferase component of 2-oxoglutarate dehydrogenase complex n=1 Tax=Bdellovibrio bacteriovorus str. Tiberius TaxID=1069642 RepID=K7Z013_BDEBC|nr:2-oxoglutarate dehydrogenase complex dihydrolipoyllysine-residue succinyltransferase [Bdellovibrio bacteriovorus]AFY02330.1 2-oxoglutarate dehydrogenase, E2 component, dihydrolipoamide succinyltransferase [Bdellovibrio bacteriovorus str. Tiberius]
MKQEIKVPAVGESITEATIGSWTKKSGDFVKRNEVLMLLETDKASVEVVAENDGVLTINPGCEAGAVVQIGATVATLDTDAKPAAGAAAPAAEAPKASAPAGAAAQPAAAGKDASAHLSPAVNRIVNEKGLDPASIQGTGKDGRLTKGDVLDAQPGAKPAAAAAPKAAPASAPAGAPALPAAASKQGDKKLVPMTTIRKRISEKLKEAQNTAALLTTFNEVDMGKVMELRSKYKDKFKEKYGVNLGFNGFFVKAVVEALKDFPAVNAWINGTDIEYHNYYNIGIAVSTEKGLMVPNVKDADTLSLAGIELAIRDLATKGRDGKITPNDLGGGTFSITNGGVFGSLLSTPILNFPQSAILGLHKIQDRPMAINGKVEIRPMMYLALTYDHRIIDGKEAVSFLVKIKELVEDPERLLLEV